jgi:lysophospholipase L1-like esterase
MRIIFFGDSLTWGGYGGNFVDGVTESLPHHEIINAGMGGNTVINLLDRLDTVLRRAPGGIFVMVGGNDAIATSQPETRHYYQLTKGAPDGRMTPELFTEAYRELLTRIRAAQVRVWVGLQITEYNPELQRTLNDFNDRIREITQELNVLTLDLAEHFPIDQLPERPPLTEDHITLIGKRTRTDWNDYETERQRGGFRYTFDGLHLTPETAQQLAKTIVKFLESTGL